MQVTLVVTRDISCRTFIKQARDAERQVATLTEDLERESQMYEREREKVATLTDALLRIANRYCLHGKGDSQQESACLDKPSDQWCSVCVARAALASAGPATEPRT